MRMATISSVSAISALLLVLQSISGQEPKAIPQQTEVHVVGLYEAASDQHFSLVSAWGEDTDWERFCAILVEQGRKKEPSPARRIWDFLDESTQKVAADREMVQRINLWVHNRRQQPPLDVLRAGRQLWDGLEKTLSRPDFYDEKSFVETVLDQEANGLLLRRKELMLLETWVLHRRLLEASFPGVVKKSTFTLEKATVPVRVLKTKNPIVLVLCSYNSVLWQVIPDKDARIDKIIVGGYHLQAVKGAPAPVTYRTYEPKPTNDYFYAYKKESESYPKMCAAVRKLTGQEVTTFEGRYSYAGGFPFMVGAAR